MLYNIPIWKKCECPKIIINITESRKLENTYVASHTYDTFGKQVSAYKFKNIRFIHLIGARRK